MAAKPRIAIVGAGNLANALAISLRQTGYGIDEVIAHSRGASLRKAQRLAKKTSASAILASTATLRSDVIWFCVPDAKIASSARSLATNTDWRTKIALHSSGALASDELDSLRRCRAAVASAHPLMTFVPRSSAGHSRALLAGVPFAIEGDAAAVRVARRIVRDLGGQSYAIRKADKAAYHAWGTFASPLFTALLATAEEVAIVAGVSRKAAKRRMIPILRQTLANYAAFGAAGAFSGPLMRGDVNTMKMHLRALRKLPSGCSVYVSLAEAALRYLPAKNKTALQKALRLAGK